MGDNYVDKHRKFYRVSNENNLFISDGMLIAILIKRSWDIKNNLDPEQIEANYINIDTSMSEILYEKTATINILGIFYVSHSSSQ